MEHVYKLAQRKRKKERNNKREQEKDKESKRKSTVDVSQPDCLRPEGFSGSATDSFSQGGTNCEHPSRGHDVS